MNVPKIRIKGFDGEWDNVALGTLFAERCEYDINAEMLSVTQNQGIIKASDNGRFDNSNNDKSKYKLVRVNDIAYNSMRMWQGACGCSPYEGIVSPAYTVVSPNSNIYSLFFYYKFKTNEMLRLFRLHSQGLTSDTWNLKYPAFSKLKIYHPSLVDEQQQIAEYFGQLDSLIEATGKKITSLKQTKLACLQQMFPAEGETTPRIRFKGFEGEWKRVKLAECLDISNETNKDNVFGKEDVLSVSDEIGVVNQIKHLGRSFAGKSLANYGVLKKGQIVYTKSPLKSKPFGIVKQNLGDTGIVSVLYAIYDVKEGADAGFIHYYFDPAWRLNAYIRPLVNKGAKNTMNISDETALEGYINQPTSLAEQQQIAAFFSNMDKQIRIQEQRLEKLKQIKAACLENMFV